MGSITLTIIGCSSRKLPVIAPAWLLYSASPRFSALFQYSKRIGDKILILSAKHGLIEPIKIIKPYNFTIADMDAHHLLEIRKSIKSSLDILNIDLISSFLGSEYNKLLPDKYEIKNFGGSIIDQMKNIGKTGSLKSFDWPFYWVLKFIRDRGIVNVNQIKKEFIG